MGFDTRVNIEILGGMEWECGYQSKANKNDVPAQSTKVNKYGATSLYRAHKPEARRTPPILLC